MFTGLLAVLIVGTLAGSVDADRGDGCHRASCYPRYDRGYYGGYGAYGWCDGYRGYGEDAPREGHALCRGNFCAVCP